MEKDETVTMTCETSKPDQKVTWLKNGKPFNFKDKNRYQVTVEGTKHTLKIPKSVLEDTAEFSVQLKEEKTTGKLTVQGEDLSLAEARASWVRHCFSGWLFRLLRALFSHFYRFHANLSL